MSSVLDGKVALVTGASRGIGKAIATRFAAEGASVVLVASRMGSHENLPGTLEEAVADIVSSRGKAAAEVADLADSSARSDLVARAERHFGPLDIVVNNAACARMDLPSRVSTEDRNWMFDVNVNAPVDLAQQALPGMLRRGRGWILAISSATANQPIVPYPDSQISAHVVGAYGATKAALDRYTQALADEVSGTGVYINSLAPESIVLTNVGPEVKAIAARRPDLVEPVEMMAEAALSLCSGTHVGQVTYSRRWLHAQARQVMSLTGEVELGNAFLEGKLG
jgi:citronellol/citronellal dehydrogenase